METQTEKQRQVESFWDAKPCDSDRSIRETGSREYFLEIEKNRYSLQSHIKEIHRWIEWKGKRVLEIGTGVGTDARNVISLGARYTGVNVDQGSTEMTAEALKAFDLCGESRKASATELPFPNQAFDVVYSFGVLHHIPDVETAVLEIFRVLKPGGELLIMVYNRNSINYYVEIMVLRKLFRRLLILPRMVSMLAALGFPPHVLERHRELYRAFGPMSNEEWLSRNTDGPDNPYSRVYGRDEIEKLLTKFWIRRNEVFFFDYRHWGILGRILPMFLVNAIGRRWGWHRVVYAIKPKA